MDLMVIINLMTNIHIIYPLLTTLQLKPMISPLKAANAAVSRELTAGIKPMGLTTGAMGSLRDLDEHKLKAIPSHETAYMPGLLSSVAKPHSSFAGYVRYQRC